jgi:hypothetical protein
MSSSNARASASMFVYVAGDDAAGSRVHAFIRGNVVLNATAAMASRRVNKESGNDISDG